jgi:SWI/SNF-related matrix-associated actin-dependent regulator of chromatin subfamily A3
VDQQKVRRAISLRHVDHVDIPPSAKTVDLTHLDATDSSHKKRKAAHDASVTPSQPTHSSSKHSRNPNSDSQSIRRRSKPVEEEVEDDASEEEVKDELYCSLSTNVVGVQYYKGLLKILSLLNYLHCLVAGLVGPGEEVILVREPDNQYDR